MLRTLKTMEKTTRQTLLKWLLLIALLAYAGWAASWALGKASQRMCQGIEVEIDNASPISVGMSAESVKSELGKLGAGYSRIPLRSINTDSLERHLDGVNNFEHVECYINSQGKLCLLVSPMVPVARVFTSDDSYYINRDGKRIDARPEYYVDVPIVTGNFTRTLPASLSLPVVNRVAADSVLRSLVTMIVYKSPRNILLVPRVRGHVVNMGDTSRLDEKFANLLLFYRKVMPVKGWNYYDTISLKYKGQVVCTRRNKSLPDHGSVTDYDDSEEAEIPLEDLAPASVSGAPVSSGQSQ